VDSLLDLQDGVITMAQALRHMSRKAVRHRLVTGRWQRPHRSVFVTHSGPIGTTQRRWIAVLSIGEHAVLGGITAAQASGLHGCGDATVHVLVPASHRPERLPPGVIVHRSSLLDERDILAVGRPPRTKIARSVVDAAQWARTEDEARAVIAAAFQQRLVVARDVQDVLRRLPRARRRRLITQTAMDAAGGTHSLAEIDFVGLCHRHDLPEPSLQVVRHDAAGRRRYLDAWFEPWQVHVEIDGGQHLDARQAWSDMRRQNDLWIAGDRVLRFPAWALRHDPGAVMAQVRAALCAAGRQESR
jgi:Protein of unknown function (DUF559)